MPLQPHLKDLARLFFQTGNGFRTDEILRHVFTDFEIDWLEKEGLIERTAKTDIWAWKSS